MFHQIISESEGLITYYPLAMAPCAPVFIYTRFLILCIDYRLPCHITIHAITTGVFAALCFIIVSFCHSCNRYAQTVRLIAILRKYICTLQVNCFIVGNKPLHVTKGAG